MLELKDISSFAQATYGPFIVIGATLLVASCFLNLRVITNRAIDLILGLFSGLQTDADEKLSPQYLRLAIAIFLVFAWYPVFRTIGNLAPISVSYNPTEAMFHNRSEWYPAISCYYLDRLASPALTGQFVWNNVEILQEDRASYYREIIGNRLGPWFFAQSMVALLFLCAIFAFSASGFRNFRLLNLLATISIIGYLFYSGYSGLENAVTERYFALLEAHYSGIPLEHRFSGECIEELRGSFSDPSGDVPNAASISLRWPEFSRLVPF